METVILINNGGYSGLTKVTFPISVEADVDEEAGLIHVPISELERIGADMDLFNLGPYAWCIPDEAVVI